MTGQLIAPRPVRLGANFHLPFFLTNALPALSPTAPSASVGLEGTTTQGHGALLLENVSQLQQAVSGPLQPAHKPDVTIEDLAAKISLDDRPASPPLLSSTTTTTTGGGVNAPATNGAAGAATNSNNTHNQLPSSSSFARCSPSTFIRGYTTSPAAHHNNNRYNLAEDPVSSLPPSRYVLVTSRSRFLACVGALSPLRITHSIHPFLPFLALLANPSAHVG
jgi:hypothetical protein